MKCMVTINNRGGVKLFPEQKKQEKKVWDESEMKTVEMEYPSELLYEALKQSTDDFIYLCNMQTGVFCYPGALIEEFALPGEVVKEPIPYWEKIVHPDDWTRFVKSNEMIGKNGQDSHAVEFRARNRMEEYVWLRCRGQLIRDEAGNPSLFAGIMTKLGKQNKVDPLTQLWNYHEFLRVLTKKLESNSLEKLGIVILDIDYFRSVNEAYGRAFGDQVLRAAAQNIQALIPDNAGLFRLEKDRLGLLIDNASDQEILDLYRQIQEYLFCNVEGRQKKLSIEISAGCALFPRDGKMTEDLYQNAEFALSYAKNHGRNHLEFFNSEIMMEKRHSMDLIRKIREAVSNQFRGFYLNYQPQIGVRSEEIIGVEALMRFRDEEGMVIPPSEFIPVMEEQGLIQKAGLWMIREALRRSREWILQNPDFSVSINISPLQFMEKNFLQELMEILKEEFFPSKNLVVELTESCEIQNMELFKDKFEFLRNQGIRVAMDDFGTGYSSLEMLKKRLVDLVKIDRGFMEDILNSKFDATIISFVVALCHNVGIKVCQEGVETEEEYEFLKKLKLDCVQGYYFGRPTDGDEISRMVACQ